MLVEEAGEGLAADLVAEVIFPPQNAVSVLLIVPVAGGDVGALGQRGDLLGAQRSMKLELELIQVCMRPCSTLTAQKHRFQSHFWFPANRKV